MHSEVFPLIPLFFFTALLYSSAGFGGGSTYLALLVLFGFDYTEIPGIALLCNIVVVGAGTFRFLRTGTLSLRRALPFILGSIPFAYWGGRIPIGRSLFFVLLGIALLIAGLRLLFSEHFHLEKTGQKQRPLGSLCALAIGAAIGFFSGLVGIGGGIFLAPLLYFLRWGKAREIAATASLFILLNSLSGLIGQWQKGHMLPFDIGFIPLALAVSTGGWLGTGLVLERFSPHTLSRVTGGLVSFAALHSFYRALV